MRMKHVEMRELPAAAAGGRTPNQSHTHKPWTAARQSHPPTTSTQPGGAQVVDQTNQVSALRSLRCGVMAP